MRWLEVTARPSPRTLRQFAGLCLIVFGLLAGLRVWRGDAGTTTIVLAAFGAIIGVIGSIKPEAIRYVYTGWMIAAFPIGWTISRVIVTALFYLVFTPFALVFRLIGRDALRLKRVRHQSYWTEVERASRVESYFSQF